MNMKPLTVSNSNQDSVVSLNIIVQEYFSKPSEHKLSQVFEAAEGLIYHFIKLYGKGLNSDDMYQAGSIGLMKALKRYDHNSSNSFTTYACALIIGEIRHYVRKENSYYMPPTIRKLQVKMDDVIGQALEREGELPTEESIAELLHVKSQGIPEIMRAGLVPYEDLNLKRIASDKYETFKLPIEDRLLLENAVKKLSDIQRKVLQHLFYDGMTQEQTAQKLGLNQRKVSRLKKSGLDSLREDIEGK